MKTGLLAIIFQIFLTGSAHAEWCTSGILSVFRPKLAAKADGFLTPDPAPAINHFKLTAKGNAQSQGWEAPVVDENGMARTIEISKVHGCHLDYFKPGLRIVTETRNGQEVFLAHLTDVEFEIVKELQLAAKENPASHDDILTANLAKIYGKLRLKYCDTKSKPNKIYCDYLSGACSALSSSGSRAEGCQRTYLHQAATSQARKEISAYCRQQDKKMAGSCKSYSGMLFRRVAREKASKGSR